MTINLKNYTKELIFQDGCVTSSYLEISPFVVLEAGKLSGSFVEILDLIMNKIGLCVKFLRPDINVSRMKQKNGSWFGELEMVVRKEAEIITCPISANHERFEVVDFSTPVFLSKYGIIYPRPNFTSNLTGLTLPFTLLTWIGVFFSLLLITGVSLLINKLFYEKINADTRTDNIKSKDSYLSLQIWFNAIITQPSPTFPKQHGIRFLIAVWLLMTLTLTVIFKSNLKALLIAKKITLPFDSLEEMVGQSTLKWSFVGNSNIAQAFKNAYFEDPLSVMGRTWSGRRELSVRVRTSHIRNVVLQNNIAFIEMHERILKIISEDFSKTGYCRFSTTRDTILTIIIAYGFRKGSKLIPLFDRHLLSMKEMGIIDRILENYAGRKYCLAHTDKESKVELRPLTFSDFYGPLALLLIGHALGIITFLIEVALKKIQMKNQIKIFYPALE